MPVPAFFVMYSIIFLNIEQSFSQNRVQQNFAEIRSTGFEHFDQEIVLPTEVTPPPSIRPKREAIERRRFAFQGFGDHFVLEVEPASHLLAPGFKVYRLGGGKTEAEREEGGCLYRGTLVDRQDTTAALNLCGGMSGLLKTESDDFLIEPASGGGGLEGPHLLKRKKRSTQPLKEDKEQSYFCGKKKRYMPHSPRRKDHWLPGEFPVPDGGGRERREAGKRRHRSVETLVVADREVVRRHGTDNVTSYLLTVFNMVSMLYQDSSIGNNVSVILVGMVLLEGDEPGLRLSHSAESSLSSFCQWQSTVHTSRGKQHDHAVLVTGLDICSWKDAPCDTLGYAPISGMCSKYRSCTVNEDSGLALAFTVAHEIGHNFGMVHDGQGSSPCRRKRGTLMSASLSGLDSRLLWSECSRKDLARFLESPRSLCLKDLPDSPDELQFPDHLPGQLYDADMQCRLQFGTRSKLCEHYPRKNEVCRALWCQRNGRECETKFLPAAEGTPCGKNKWCRKGECLDRSVDSQNVINGGWSQFSDWSNCSKHCGGGIKVRERVCDSPPPSNGGSYCKGVENEYQICGTEECKADSPEYRNDECSTFNKRTVKGKFYQWKPYGKDLGALSRCRIYCVPNKEDLYLVLSTKLQDGTSCSGNFSGVCIDGECRNVGCDGKIDSSISPDLCGVCNGDNSTCVTVRGNFSTSNLTTGYHEVTRVPPHSRHIHVSEERDCPSSFLSLRGGLNEGWLLDWPGRYKAAGATFSYRRWPGRPESLATEGPTTEELVIEVILQEEVESVIQYDFVVPSMSPIWKMKNSTCSLTCGNGVFLSSPVCVTSENMATNDVHCDASKMPGKTSYPCILAPCPSAHWQVGEWSMCDKCDANQQQTRDVFCLQKGQRVVSNGCASIPRPAEVRECAVKKCQHAWHTGAWSKCRGTCISGFQTRSVTCRSDSTAESFSKCESKPRPPHTRACSRNCHRDNAFWSTGPWSQCNTECEETRNVSCVKKNKDSTESSTSCDLNLKPSSKQKCSKAKCNFGKKTDCIDLHEWCPTSTNKDLCELKFYATNCCKSCRTIL